MRTFVVKKDNMLEEVSKGEECENEFVVYLKETKEEEGGRRATERVKELKSYRSKARLLLDKQFIAPDELKTLYRNALTIFYGIFCDYLYRDPREDILVPLGKMGSYLFDIAYITERGLPTEVGVEHFMFACDHALALVGVDIPNG